MVLPPLVSPVSSPTTRTRVKPTGVSTVRIRPMYAWLVRASTGPSTTGGMAGWALAAASAAVNQRPTPSR